MQTRFPGSSLKACWDRDTAGEWVLSRRWQLQGLHRGKASLRVYSVRIVKDLPSVQLSKATRNTSPSKKPVKETCRSFLTIPQILRGNFPFLECCQWGPTGLPIRSHELLLRLYCRALSIFPSQHGGSPIGHTVRQGGESWAEAARSQGRRGGSGWQGWEIGYNLDAGKGAKNSREGCEEPWGARGIRTNTWLLNRYTNGQMCVYTDTLPSCPLRGPRHNTALAARSQSTQILVSKRHLSLKRIQASCRNAESRIGKGKMPFLSLLLSLPCRVPFYPVAFFHNLLTFGASCSPIHRLVL